MGFIVVISIVVMILMYQLAEKSQKSNVSVNAEKRKDFRSRYVDGVEVTDLHSTYIGGFPDVAGGIKAQIMVKQNEIQVGLWKVGGLDYKVIPMNIVTNAGIKSENQIRQEISLGKMIVFGALAFAMKNEKNVVKNYLVITCNENGNNSDLVFESRQVEKIVSEIRRIKNIQTVF